MLIRTTWNKTLGATRRAARAGFTLIELLAVILIIGILMTFLLPKIPEAIDRAEVTACKANMNEIYKGFLSYKGTFNRAPNKCGVKFFADLIASRTWENTEASAKKLTCPGVDQGALAIGDLPPTEWFADLEVVDGTYSTYAGRNTTDYPLRKFPGSGTQALVADDNDPEPNHRTSTVVLFADGSVKAYEWADLNEQGLFVDEDEFLLVGPESQLEELQVLSLDE